MDAVELLRKTPLFAELSDADLAELSQSTRIEICKPGQIIIREGRVGAAFYVLVRGEVEVIQGMTSPEPEVITVLRAGDFFGEFAALKHGPRSASVRALETCTCLAIRRLDLDAYLDRYPAITARVTAALSDRFGIEE